LVYGDNLTVAMEVGIREEVCNNLQVEFTSPENGRRWGERMKGLILWNNEMVRKKMNGEIRWKNKPSFVGGAWRKWERDWESEGGGAGLGGRKGSVSRRTFFSSFFIENSASGGERGWRGNDFEEMRELESKSEKKREILWLGSNFQLRVFFFWKTPFLMKVDFFPIFFLWLVEIWI
jgi:hypothetical protein